MSPADVSLFVFAFYVTFAGVGYFFFPKVLLKLMNEEAADVYWVRLFGSLAMGIAFYYFYVSLNGITDFYMATVIARYGVFALWTGMALVRKDYQMILFALVDAAGATWTLLTII